MKIVFGWLPNRHTPIFETSFLKSPTKTEMAELGKVNEHCQQVSPVLRKLRKDMLREKKFLAFLFNGNSRKNRRKLQNASVPELNVLLRVMFCIERGEFNMASSFYVDFANLAKLGDMHTSLQCRTHPTAKTPLPITCV